MRGALEVLEALAQYEGPAEPVWTRAASLIDSGDSDHPTFLLDLCNERWQVVQIDRDGWRVLDRSPVKFRRTGGMRPLPVPIPGGTLEDLRRFVNIPAPKGKAQPDRAWMLFIAALTAAFRSYGPYPILEINGEQGCAKSTTSRVFRACVDPHKVMLRSMPKEDRDLMISANNCWCQAFDNLSRLPEWLSDALCRQATGGGLSLRRLYTDEGETHFDTMRPVLLTGIASVVDRDDLSDRLIRLVLPVIPAQKRREEAIFWREFDQALPQILGAILDVVAGAIKALPDVHLESLPRMADFARWGVAVGRALPWPEGAFLDAYQSNRDESSLQVLEDSAVAVALRTLMKTQQIWEGTHTDLLNELTVIAGEAVVKDKAQRWPKDATRLSGQLRRLAPSLRKVGIALHLDLPLEGQDRRRIIQIEKSSGQAERDGKTASAALPAIASPPGNVVIHSDDHGLCQTDGQSQVRAPAPASALAAPASALAAPAGQISPKPDCQKALDSNGRPIAGAAGAASADSPTSSSRGDDENSGPREVFYL